MALDKRFSYGACGRLDGLQGVAGRAQAAGWCGMETLEQRLLLAGTAPVFLEPLSDQWTTQDESFTVVIDAFDADGDPLTIVASSNNINVVPTVTQNGTFARLNFVDYHAAEMGYIMIELFPTLTPNTVDRFITLATNELIDDGQGGVNLDPNGTPYYTDVVVHRVIDDFMFQTGDAEFGDGTGGSLLGPFADEFDPSLDFSDPGVVAMANSGPDTQDSQFFITEVATPWLDGVHTIFGQMLSGWDVYHAIMALPTDANDRPINPPLLQSVEIFDTVVSLEAPDGFEGSADITVSLDDGNGNVTEETFTMTYDRTAPVVAVNPLTTGDSTPALTGFIVDDDPAASILVTVNGVDYNATNNGDGTWSVSITSPLAPAVYDVAITATDTAGNSGTDGTTDELTIVPYVTVDPLATSDTTPPLSGTVADPAADILVAVNGTIYTAVNNGDGTWTLADDTIASALADGTYDVMAIASNVGAGTFGIDDTTDELDIDTVDPVVTVDTLTTNDDTPPLTGTIDEPDATISVNVDGTDYPATNNGDGTWTLADDTIAPALGEGTYDVAVTATDPAGNVGTDATTDELTINAVPTVTIDPLTTNDTTPPLTGTVDDPAAVVVANVDGTDYLAVNNGDGTWTLADDTITALADGTYDVLVTGTNANGDGTDTTTDELVIDTVAPVVTVDTLITPDDTPELTGTVDDADATISVNVNGTDYPATNNGDGTWTLADDTIAPALGEATYDVAATATDAAGNAGTDATADELEVNFFPVVTINDLTTNDTTPALGGTISDPAATISVNVDGTDYPATNNGDGTWTLTDDTIAPALGENTYVATVTATNGLANQSQDTGDLVIDLTTPAITVDPLTTTFTNPELTGTVDDPTATIFISVAGQDAVAVNNGDGTWTLPAGSFGSALTASIFDVEATAADPAGNFGTDPTLDELTVRSETTVTLGGGSLVRSVWYRDPDGTIVKISLLDVKHTATVLISFASNSLISRVSSRSFREVIDAPAGAVVSLITITSQTQGLWFSTRGGTVPGATLGGIAGLVDLLTGGISMADSVIHSVTLRSMTGNIAMTGIAPRGVTFTIRQAIQDANIWLPNADIRSITTGSMIDSSAFSGVLGPRDNDGDGVDDLPDVVDLKEGFTIHRITIRGFRGAVGDLFTNVNIAADSVLMARLRDATLDNASKLFGVTTNNLRRLMLRQGRTNFTFGRNWLADPIDLTVRLV